MGTTLKIGVKKKSQSNIAVAANYSCGNSNQTLRIFYELIKTVHLDY